MNQRREVAASNFGAQNFGNPDEQTIAHKLSQQLGPEFISQRAGPGGSKVSYLEGWKATQIANDIFGFNGWASTVIDMTVDFVDIDSGRVSMGISAIVRVTLKDGSFHEDVGYGSIDNAKSKAAAFEKSKKEAVTDATKRALKNFGNSVGACLYDKDYLKKISRMPAPKPHNLVLENLYRHRDFAAPSGNSHHLPTNTPRTNINNANIPPPSNMPIGQNSIKKEFANVKNEAKNEIEMGDDDMDLLVAADLESIDPRLLAGPSPSKPGPITVPAGPTGNVNGQQSATPPNPNPTSKLPANQMNNNITNNPHGSVNNFMNQSNGAAHSNNTQPPHSRVLNPTTNLQPSHTRAPDNTNQGSSFNNSVRPGMPSPAIHGRTPQNSHSAGPNHPFPNAAGARPPQPSTFEPPRSTDSNFAAMRQPSLPNLRPQFTPNADAIANFANRSNSAAPSSFVAPVNSANPVGVKRPLNENIISKPGNMNGNNVPFQFKGRSNDGNNPDGGFQYANPVQKRTKTDIPGFT